MISDMKVTKLRRPKPDEEDGRSCFSKYVCFCIAPHDKKDKSKSYYESMLSCISKTCTKNNSKVYERVIIDNSFVSQKFANGDRYVGEMWGGGSFN
jgi:hypothetical protein